ncbi:MAG: long-chain fatty acid transporter [Gammaproteobacteria bacterium]|nr:MAG: long-chain fatty acid transporter [Gammaproteobacteria bacterium]RLA44183.1 MAG: long-chain fatty acid transporter [Gammaproteobacteria bacterium]
MLLISYKSAHLSVSLVLLIATLSTNLHAGGGYFAMGYGPVAWQTAGAVTAVAQDAFAGASNPAKLSAAGNQLDLSLSFLNPNRKVKRTGTTGPASVYNFSSTSKNSLFLVPEFAYSRQISDQLALGITSYANGGMNIEYKDTTGIPGTNLNPTVCGTRPGNFMGGCGELGFDMAQLIVAPTVAWKFAPGQSVGISPLLTLQMFKAYGLQAFAPSSRSPNHVSNKGQDYAFGGGVRVGWFGEFNPWLSLGAAYSSKIYMQDFDKYKGLLVEGSFDVPANYSVGIAIKPRHNWLVAFDIQRIEFKNVRALGNGILPSLVDPVANPLGSRTGSGFGWQRNQTNYKLGVIYNATPSLTLRAGYTYGRRANDNDLDAASFGVLAVNPIRAGSVGMTWKTSSGDELHMGYARMDGTTYGGPSAIFPGARESVRPYVNAINIAWSRHM